MNPFDAIAKFGLGLIHEGHLQGWMKLFVSILATAFVTFFGTVGLSLVGLVLKGTPAGLAAVLALGYACTAMAVSVLGLWLRSPLTKGIPILYPGKIEAARIESLQTEGVVFNPNDKR